MGIIDVLRSGFMPGEQGGMPDGGYGAGGVYNNPQQVPAGTYGSRAAKLKRMREMADLLRQQSGEAPADKFMPGWTSALTGASMSPRLVAGGNDVGTNILRGLGGVAAAYGNKQVDQEEGLLDQQARNEAQSAMRNIPSMVGKRTVEQVVPGEEVPVEQSAPQSVPTSPYGTSESLPSTPGTMLPQARAKMTRAPDTVKQVEEQYALSPEEYSQNLNSYLGTLDPTNPHLATTRESVLKQALDMPEKIMMQQQKAEDAAAAATEKYAVQKELAQQRHEERMAQLASQEQRDRERNDFLVAQHNSKMQHDREMAAIYKMTASQQYDLRNAALSAKDTAAQQKIDAATEKQAEAKQNISSLLDNAETQVDILDKGEGIPSDKNRSGTNVKAWVSNTGLGQTVGKVFATKNQDARNNLAQIASYLLLELKNAKNLSASQMNSNMELQRYLAAVAGGEQFSAQSLRDNIKRTRELLTASSSNQPDTGGGEEWVRGADGKLIRK